MKNIENYNLLQVETALQRLDQAMARLESAAVKAEGSAARATEVAQDHKNLEEKLGGLTRAHATLKETSGRVATQLDAAIYRLSAALQD